MKYISYKIFAVFGALLFAGALLSPVEVSASTTFNTFPQDWPTVRVSNYTNNPGCTTCWSSSVSADPGDIVSVIIYYHNTGHEPAYNTTLHLSPQSTGNGSSHTFNGTVNASNASGASGSATVNLTQASSLTFDGFIAWYPNHTLNNTALPGGQSGNNLFSGSLNLGTINPDNPWGTYTTDGAVVVHFQVANAGPTGSLTVETDPETFVSSNSAVLHGRATSIGSFGTGWFEWGTSTSMGNSTPHNIVLTENVTNYPFQYSLTGLASNQTYYYKACGQNQATSDCGGIESFTTDAGQTDICSILNFYASPSSILSGDDTTLFWQTDDCNYVTISNISGSFPGDGSVNTSNLFSDKTYTLTAHGDSNTDVATITIDVDQGGSTSNCEIDDFHASDTSIDEGDDITLFWDTTGCDEVIIESDTQGDLGNVSLDGDEDINNIDEDVVFTLKAYDNGNLEDTDTVSINVSADDDDDAGDDCDIDEFEANPDNVDYGDSTELSWETSGSDCDEAKITGGGMSESNLDVDDTLETDDLFGDTTFTLRVYNEDGDEVDSDTVRVEVDGIDVDQNISVTTIGASPGTNSAILQGYLSSEGGGTVQTFFEWGGSTSLGASTIAASLSGGADTPFTSTISGLASNTLYYFRAVAIGSDSGRVEGEIKAFRTLASSVVVPAPTVVVSGGTGTALLKLDLLTDFETVREGDMVRIIARYENTSSSRSATDTVLRIQFPKDLIFLRATTGDYSEIDHELTILLGTVSPREKGEIIMEGEVSNRARTGDLLVTAGTLTYETRGVKEEVIDVVTHRVGGGNNLWAFALGAGFFPGLIGLLLLILLLLIIIYLARRFFGEQRVAQPIPLPPSYNYPPQTR